MRYWVYMQKYTLRFCSSFPTRPGSGKRTHLKIPVLWVELGSPNRHVEVPPPEPVNVALTMVFAEVTKLR